MGKKNNEPKPRKSGCLGFFRSLLTLFLIVLGGVVYLIFTPQDLSDVDGYRPRLSTAPSPGRDIEQVLKASLANRSPATLTEEEVNAYLLRTLRMKQEGPLKPYVEITGVWVRFRAGVGEVIIEREINLDLQGKALKRRQTVSMHLEIEQKVDEGGALLSGVNPAGHGKEFVERLLSPNAGRFGKLPIVEGYLRVVDKGFKGVMGCYPEIGKTFTEMLTAGMRIKFEEGLMVIREPDDEHSAN